MFVFHFVVFIFQFTKFVATEGTTGGTMVVEYSIGKEAVEGVGG